MEDYKDSYKGKLWSTAIETAMRAPFPEVALQHLLLKVEYLTQVQLLEDLLSFRHEAINEREAISPMNIVNRVEGDNIPPFTNETVRKLQYVKVWDIQKRLETLREKKAS